MDYSKKDIGINRRAHRGVAVFIHENTPFKEITINIPLQAIEARINIGIDVTIVSIYNSRIHDINENLLTTLFNLLPKPVILTGDFNSYIRIWGSPENDVGGVKVLEFIEKNQLNILNDGRYTRASGTSKSAINLTIASPSLQPIPF